jgi:hypothetical protein
MRGVKNTAKKHGPLTSILSPVPGARRFLAYIHSIIANL